MEDAVIVSAVRTPVGSFGGDFKNVAGDELGAHAVRAALERAGISGDEVDEVVLGNVLQAGLGLNPARQAAIAAGIPQEVPSTTINKLCGSGSRRSRSPPRRSAGRRGRRRRRRHGEHDARALPVAGRALRRPHGRRRARRLDGHRRALGRLQRHPHGRHGREPRRQVRHRPRGAGRVRRRQPAEGRARDRRRGLQGRDRADRGAGQGRHPRGRYRRAPAGRHDRREAGEAASGLPRRRRHRHGGQRVRRQRRRGGARRDVGAPGPGARPARRSGRSRAMPRSASSRGSWASARCPPCARRWSGRGSS